MQLRTSPETDVLDNESVFNDLVGGGVETEEGGTRDNGHEASWTPRSHRQSGGGSANAPCNV